MSPSSLMQFGPPALLAFVISVAATPIVRALARRFGAVAAPKTDRWHKKPTAMLGGIAIFIAVITACIIAVPQNRHTWVVLAASTFLFLVGLIDDFFHIKPYHKLIGQVMAATVVLYFGMSLPWTGSPILNSAITIFWIVGITNATNMLDNMDGLAGGIAAIGAVFLALNFMANAQAGEATMLIIFAAALVAFLIFNFNPASIFMGDCGSMFIGFFLASTALLTVTGTAGRTRSIVPVLAVPLLILFIPIFDTTFVTVLRKLSGRAASQGGRDHTSHRLVALGLSERRAVLMLYGFAIVSGLLSLAVRGMDVDVSLALIVGFSIGLTFLGVYLAQVKVYDEEEIARAQQAPLVAFLVNLSYKRRIFEVTLDVVLIILSYYSAYALVFGPYSDSTNWQIFSLTLPIVVFAKIAAFLSSGVYRGIWRYLSIENVLVYVRAVIFGTIATSIITFALYRMNGMSRTVLVLDALILLSTVTISRLGFKLLRRAFPILETPEGHRVLIYGAGDAGELLLRELRNNRELQYVPVGFLDDDPLKIAKTIHGLPVHSGAEIEAICLRHTIDEVVISSAKVIDSRLREISEACELAGVPLKRMKIHIEPVRLTESIAAQPAEDPASAPLPEPELADSETFILVRGYGSTQILDKPSQLLSVNADADSLRRSDRRRRENKPLRPADA